MPGLESCVQCGSVLKAAAGPIETQPPRMPKWKLPFRSFIRSLRAMGVPVMDMPETEMPEWVKLLAGIGFFGVVLSFIPGLGHAILRSFKKIRWYILAWAILLPLAIFLFGSVIGNIVLGLAFGLHVWIAMHCSLIREHEEFSKRMIAFVFIAICYAVIYRAVFVLTFRDIVGAQSTMKAPSLQIQTGDFLLARRSLAVNHPLERGAMVIARMSSIGGDRHLRDFFIPPADRSFAQVIALPGEELEIKDKCFYIDGKPLDTGQYPVPDWIGKRELKTIVPESCYFVSALYNGNRFGAGQIISVCTLPWDRIEAKVFMRWQPLTRRGYIRENE